MSLELMDAPVMSYDSGTRLQPGQHTKGWTIRSMKSDCYRMDETPRGRRRAA